MWYDPARISDLRSATVGALEEIGSIVFDDPAAADARHAVMNLRVTLDDVWMPSLDRIYDSQAMIEWRRIYGEHGPVRIVNGLQRGHRNPDDRCLSRLDEILAALDANDDLVFPQDLVDRLDVVLAVIDRDGIRLSIERLDMLLGVIEQLDWMEASGKMAINPTRRRRLTTIFVAYFSSIIGTGAAFVSDSEALGRHHHWIIRSPVLVNLITDHAHRVDDETLAAITRTLLTFNRLLGSFSTVAHSLGRWDETNALLAIVARSPDLVTRVIEGDALVALATDPLLDPELIESILATALADDIETGLVTLGRLIDLAGDDLLTTGARRGIARGLAVLFTPLAPNLDGRSLISVTVGDAQIRIGSYEKLTGLLGQILEDDISQLIIGLGVSAMRRDRMNDVRDFLSEGFIGGSFEATLAVGAAMADITRIMELFDTARLQRDQLLAIRHATVAARTASIVGIAGSAISTAPVVGRVIAFTASEAVKTAFEGRERRIGGEYIDAAWSYEIILLLMELPAVSVPAREALGLSDISESTWADVRSLVEEAGRHPERLPEIVSRLRALGLDYWRINNYIRFVKAVSAEDAFE